MQRIFSGIQPSGIAHLGNYLGAIRNWVALQHSYECIYCVVDLHAITENWHGPDALARQTREMAAVLLACGIDPDKHILFAQSSVRAHAQLAWICNCVARIGWLNRMTQFKDKAGKNRENASAGLYVYPNLMAADILAYHATAVPVGEDQRQHLELTRNLAQRFNGRYGDTFTVPEAYIPTQSAKILDLQEPTAKMSKSLPDAGTLNLLDEPAVLTRKIKRAVTDTGSEVRYDPANKPGVSNLLAILAAVTDRPVPQIEQDYAGSGYGALKSDVAEAVVAFAAPFGARTRELLDDPAELDRVLAFGAERAVGVAAETLRRAYDRVGFLLPNVAARV
jgi:tryptophanyl-tRNA synthetase